MYAPQLHLSDMKQEDYEYVLHRLNSKLHIGMFVALSSGWLFYVFWDCQLTVQPMCVYRKEYQILDLAQEYFAEQNQVSDPAVTVGATEAVQDLAKSLARDWDDEEKRAHLHELVTSLQYLWDSANKASTRKQRDASEIKRAGTNMGMLKSKLKKRLRTSIISQSNTQLIVTFLVILFNVHPDLAENGFLLLACQPFYGHVRALTLGCMCW